VRREMETRERCRSRLMRMQPARSEMGWGCVYVLHMFWLQVSSQPFQTHPMLHSVIG
jgi:hypothetical protein